MESFPSNSPLQFAFFVILIVFSKSIFCAAQSTPLSIETDREALISFRSQLNLQSSNPLSSWDENTNTSPCNWTRVSCNVSVNRVTALDLSGLRLMGPVSPHIGNLSFLNSLQLQENKFTGMLPDQIGNLFRLRVLNIGFNNIEGLIPPSISNLVELNLLDLNSNKITGKIPQEISNLTNLQVLNLGRNLLWGDIPPFITNLSSLTNLNLGTNSLSGLIPSELGLLRLKELDLTINNLSGTVPSSIYNMTSLVYMALASNNLWGNLPSDIADTLPNLTGLNVCFNKFTGTIPGSLHNRTNMRIIRMASNFLEGQVPPGLGNLPELEMYNIGFNKIVSSGDEGLSFLTSLTNSTRLNFLAIDGNQLEGLIPQSIGNLSKVLSKLYMGGNRIYGKIPDSITQLSGLTLLNVSYNSISGEIPAQLGQLEELQVLSLAGNQISGSIPNTFGNLRKLNHIELSGNELVGNIPASFGNCKNLLSMDLSNNRLNGSIPKEILNLPSLSTVLNLSNNLLSGPLPQEIGELENVAAIDLSHNRLSNDIPTSIGDCKSLEKLFIANNLISGPIPSRLGELKGLEILDLSSNQLSGSIPAELKELQALLLLNLSYNNLEGEVPRGRVFGNSSRVYLEGNPNLCSNLACNRGGRGSRVVKYLIGVVAIIATIALCSLIGSLFYLRKSKAKVTKSSELLTEKHQLISYDELRGATMNFNQENLIGKGSFGSVYRGYLRSGDDVAIKVFDIGMIGYWKSFLAECEALKNMRHRNLVKLITSCSSMDYTNMEFVALVYEYLSNGSLEDWVTGKRMHTNGEKMNVLERLDVIIDIACALDYMHHDCDVPIVHCDLKPSNILLDETMVAKVGDFGLARLLTQPSISTTHALKGSIGYIPPEYGFGTKPSTAGDVYSYGVMLLELFTAKSPTHESFIGGLNIIKWVQSAYPAKIVKVLDSELLQIMGNLQHDSKSISMEAQVDCLITIIRIGLSCTADSPDARAKMRDVLPKLHAARRTLLKPMPIEKIKSADGLSHSFRDI